MSGYPAGARFLHGNDDDFRHGFSDFFRKALRRTARRGQDDVAGRMDADVRELVEQGFVIPVKVLAGAAEEDEGDVLGYGEVRPHGMKSPPGREDVGVRIVAVRAEIVARNEAEVEEGAGEGGFHAQHGFCFEVLACADERKMRGVPGGNEQIGPRLVVPGDDLADFAEGGEPLQLHNFHSASRFGDKGLSQPQRLVEVALFAVAQNPDVHMCLLWDGKDVQAIQFPRERRKFLVPGALFAMMAACRIRIPHLLKILCPPFHGVWAFPTAGWPVPGGPFMRRSCFFGWREAGMQAWNGWPVLRNAG